MPVGSFKSGLFGGGLAVPDVNLDHFYWAPSILDISTWPDDGGAADLSVNGSPTLSTVNGVISVDYGGWDDYHQNASAFGFGANDVYTFVAVVQADSTNVQNPVIDNGDGSSTGILLRGDSTGVWEVVQYGDAVYTGPSMATDPIVIVGTNDGTDVIVDFDGTNEINTTSGTPTAPAGDWTVGARPANSVGFNGNIVAAGWEAAAADQTRRNELTDKLADPLGIPVST